MKQIKHAHISDASLLHQTFHYQQSSDPGAVGAGLFWLDTNGTESFWENGLWTAGVWNSSLWLRYYRLKFRNDANDGWVTI